jgi:Flp pilus assembly protein TadD
LVEIANSLEESSESSDASPDSQIGFFRKNAIASYENSLKVLDVAVKLMPNAAEVHNSLGRTLVVLNRDEEASNEFKIASEIDPSNLTARENQNTLGILTKAEAALDELSTLITSFQEQGYAFFNSGQYTDAISMFNEIIRLHPDDPQAYNVRGIAYGRLGQNHDAISDFDKAIELNPDHAVHSFPTLVWVGTSGRSMTLTRP